MYSKAVLFSFFAALTQARFGQEQIPIAAIQAVTSGGAPGVADTLAGSAIGTLLAAANPCAKLQKADEIIAQLGMGADAVKAAQGLVAAEQNFNPFVVHVPSICSDPTLPTTPILRGIVPLVDPAVGGSALENQNSAASLKNAFSAAGISVAQVMAAHGFSNFTTKDLAGNVGAAPGGSVAVASSNPDVVSSSAEANSNSRSSTSCILTVTVTQTSASTPTIPAGTTTMITVAIPASSASAVTSSQEVEASSAASGGNSVQKSTIAGLDFGLCVPTMKFEPGLDGRPDTEFTFQAIDPLVNKGQEEALNPNIITNRICDQLTNVCNANAAAKSACQAAKAQILALGTRDVTTADAWNTALGFAGTNTNPDSAPKPGLIGHS